MKKLLELIKKLLGGSSSSSNDSSSGFTLIELLIVIAILGILAAGLLVALDPAERIRQSSDTRAINDISEISKQIEQWTIQTGDGGIPGDYPDSVTEVNTANIKWNAPSGYSYTFTPDANGANTFSLRVDALLSKKYTTGTPPAAGPRFIYDSSRGRTCFTAAAATLCN